MTHFIFDGRTLTIEQQKAISESDSTHMRIPINMRWIVLYIWHFMTNQPQTIKMRFYFYWPEPFYVSSSDIHTYSFSFCFSLSLSSQFNSVRFSLALCCMLVVFVLFRFVFLFQIWGYTQVFNEKFHRLFSSWNVQIVDAWWLIRNCAAVDKKSRAQQVQALLPCWSWRIYLIFMCLQSGCDRETVWATNLK